MAGMPSATENQEIPSKQIHSNCKWASPGKGREGRREAGDPSASGRSQQEKQHRPREREDLSGFEPEEISPVFLAFP